MTLVEVLVTWILAGGVVYFTASAVGGIGARCLDLAEKAGPMQGLAMQIVTTLMGVLLVVGIACAILLVVSTFVEFPAEISWGIPWLKVVGIMGIGMRIESDLHPN